MNKPERLTFPTGSREGAEWDSFWRLLLPKVDPQELANMRLAPASFLYRRYFEIFDELKLKKVLVAGNGVSIVPNCLCHAGFSVTAIDISPVATAYCQEHAPEEWLLFNFFNHPVPRSMYYSYPGAEHNPKSVLYQAKEALRKSYRPGGVLEFLTQDVFDYEPGDSSLDSIFMIHLTEDFSEGDRPALAHQCFRWLKPGGVLIVEDNSTTLNTGWAQTEDPLAVVFENAGFLIHMKSAYIWWKDQFATKWWQVNRRLKHLNPPDAVRDELGQRQGEAAASDFDRVRQGQKLLILR